MTPLELRERGYSFIESAERLLEAKNLDNASYLCGYAAELGLKARFCTLNNWPDFPDDKREARRRNAPDRLLSHDLDRLLELTDKARIDRGGLHHIDWEKASDWSSEQRYERLGTATRPATEAQVKETRKLWVELMIYQLVDRLVAIERQLSSEMGPFNLFALLEGFTGSPGRTLLMSAPWIDDTSLQEICRRIRGSLDPDLFAGIRQIRANAPDDVAVRRFHAFTARGPWEHMPVLQAGNIVVGQKEVWFPASGVIITNVMRLPPGTPPGSIPPARQYPEREITEPQ
jgi:hypothetical protein